MSGAEDRADNLMVIALIAGFILFIFGMVYGIGSQDATKSLPRVDIEKDDTLQLTGAPGETVEFLITRRMFGDTRWRSPDGIDVVVDGESQQAIKPRDKQWSESLNKGSSQSNEPGNIRGRLRIPDSAEVGESLRGALAGEITVALITSSTGFDNVTQGVNNPVEIRVVSQAESAELRAERERGGRRLARIGAYGAAGSAAVILVTWVAAWWIKRR